MREFTKERVLTLMSEHLGVERAELTDDTLLDDMMDELDLLELIMAMEESFGVELPDEIEEAFNGVISPFEQLFMDGADGKFKGKSDEEIIELFKEAARKERNVQKGTTVGQFLKLLEPYLS
jgi:acyl carrier protein